MVMVPLFYFSPAIILPVSKGFFSSIVLSDISSNVYPDLSQGSAVAEMK